MHKIWWRFYVRFSIITLLRTYLFGDEGIFKNKEKIKKRSNSSQHVIQPAGKQTWHCAVQSHRHADCAKSDFWPTVLSVAPLAHCVVCLSSVCLSSVTFCIVAKRYVLAKNCLKERIGNQGQKVCFFGSPPYFYFRFRRYGHRDGRFYLIFACTAHQSVLDGTNWLSSSKPYAYIELCAHLNKL